MVHSSAGTCVDRFAATGRAKWLDQQRRTSGERGSGAEFHDETEKSQQRAHTGLCSKSLADRSEWLEIYRNAFVIEFVMQHYKRNEAASVPRQSPAPPSLRPSLLAAVYTRAVMSLPAPSMSSVIRTAAAAPSSRRSLATAASFAGGFSSSSRSATRPRQRLAGQASAPRKSARLLYWGGVRVRARCDAGRASALHSAPTSPKNLGGSRDIARGGREPVHCLYTLTRVFWQDALGRSSRTSSPG